MQQLLLRKEDVLPEQQEENQSLDQKHSEPPNIKEEQEELWVSQVGKQLHGLEEADITKFPLTIVCVKSEDDEKPQSSQLPQSQREESTEVELHSNNSTEPRTLKIEADGEDCGGSQPARDSGPCSHLQPHTDDMQQLLLIKEEILPEQQKWNLSDDQKDIKEEQEKLWISRPGQQLRQLEEADITKFSFTAVPVKSENDKNPQSSQVHQGRSDESREVEPGASSSTVHRTLTAQTDGEDYGGPQPASNSGPYSRLRDTSGRGSDSSEIETDDSCEWKQTRELHSGFNGQTKSDVCVHNSKCSITKKQFTFSQCGKAFGHMNYSKEQTGIQACEKQFSCSKCGKRFEQKGELNTHMRIHSGQKLFGCYECRKRFGWKDDLIRHMKIHTEEKLFGCSDCGKRFGRKGSLKSHMKIHTRQKPFLCCECGTRFGQKASLVTHMRIHTGEKPFVCTECGNRFSQKSSLTVHMGIHTGEKRAKPFVCTECGDRFSRKGSLTLHVRIHTGETAVNCPECGDNRAS